MPQKVYRLHEGSQNSGWFESFPFTTTDLATIKTFGKEIATSIPTPYARIDLVKTAFEYLSQATVDIHYHKDTEINKAHHKLVSESLDVAQLFFEFRKFEKQLKIIAYNPKKRIDLLKDSSNLNHKSLAETLDVFWKLDGSVFNFDKVKSLYFIMTQTNELIGSTSPTTLFMPAPDITKTISNLPPFVCGKNKLFDNNYLSLDQRDEDFIIYFYTLSKQPNFPTNFKEINEYIQRIREYLPEHIKNRIAKENDLNNYSPCLVMDMPGNPCEVLGVELKLKNNSAPTDSDFIIKSDYTPQDTILPLVLPNTSFTEKWIYTSNDVIWDPNYKVPDKNTNSYEESLLPEQKIPYYWLSMDNFLEEKIIELPYDIDKTKFQTCGSARHLLPLTQTFFQYFKVENVSIHLELIPLAGKGIQAILKIPTKKGSITYKKIYNPVNIIKLDIHIAVLPFLKSADFNIDYTIGIQDARLDKTPSLSIECINYGKIVKVSTPQIRREAEEGTLIQSIYYKSEAFNCIRVGNEKRYGSIVPKMKECSLKHNVSFAIDFGTTNTHIEYKVEDQTDKSLDISANEPIWQSLLDVNAENKPEVIKTNEEFEREIFPYEFNGKNNKGFPIRTAITYSKTDFLQPFEVFLDYNNYFLLEKVFYRRSMKLETGIKWGNYKTDKDRKLVESYIENLLTIVLYKTLQLNGNPIHSNITWFYPVSMSLFQQNTLSSTWTDSYKKVFKTDNVSNLHKIPESIAPYLYYRTLKVGSGLSIDIGGGSTDIALFRNGEDLPAFISSIKFAGNSIFGDRFENSKWANNTDSNGFVKKFKDAAERAIKSITTSERSNIEAIYHNIIKERKNSADFSSFLFSLEKVDSIDFSYTKLLQNDEYLKLPILLFYTSIIYYSANLCKRKNIRPIPDNIFLSGTASKTLKILDPSKDFKSISRLFMFIFDKVMDDETATLHIVVDSNPKEITCKGVLKASIDESIDSSPIIYWIGGNDSSPWAEVLDKKTGFNSAPQCKDLAIEHGIKDAIKNSIEDYFKVIDNYFTSIGNIKDEFGINPAALKIFENIRSSKLEDYLDTGIKCTYEEATDKIEETLFFYPLSGLLNELAYNLAKD